MTQTLLKIFPKTGKNTKPEIGRETLQKGCLLFYIAKNDALNTKHFEYNSLVNLAKAKLLAATISI